jgi:hypothetical protein
MGFDTILLKPYSPCFVHTPKPHRVKSVADDQKCPIIVRHIAPLGALLIEGQHLDNGVLIGQVCMTRAETERTGIESHVEY